MSKANYFAYCVLEDNFLWNVIIQKATEKDAQDAVNSFYLLHCMTLLLVLV